MGVLRGWSTRRRGVAFGVVLLLAVSAVVHTGYQAFADSGTEKTECADASVPVEVGGVEGSIAGTLCTPPGATSVQLLVHGWTYNRHYFDPGYESETYSYARAANKAGYATFAIDRLAAGESLHPLGLFDTFDEDVRTVHEVVTALRDGSVGTEFDKVVTVGHSIGSSVIAAEAGKYGDVDAMITTGYTHAFNSVYTAPTIAGRDHLAAGDEEFADRDLDPLYLTSIPGTRYTFYEPDHADPGMIETDEDDMRDTSSLIKLATQPIPADLRDQNRDTDIPVLAVAGEKEPFFCGLGTASCDTDAAIADFESEWYGDDATVEGFSVPGSGHAIHLEKNSKLATERMLEFVDEYIGPGQGRADTESGDRPQPVEQVQSKAPLTYRLANKALSSAVLPLVDAYAEDVETLPGMDGTNPVPVSGDLMVDIAKITKKLLNGLDR